MRKEVIFFRTYTNQGSLIPVLPPDSARRSEVLCGKCFLILEGIFAMSDSHIICTVKCKEAARFLILDEAFVFCCCKSNQILFVCVAVMELTRFPPIISIVCNQIGDYLVFFAALISQTRHAPLSDTLSRTMCFLVRGMASCLLYGNDRKDLTCPTVGYFFLYRAWPVWSVKSCCAKSYVRKDIITPTISCYMLYAVWQPASFAQL